MIVKPYISMDDLGELSISGPDEIRVHPFSGSRLMEEEITGVSG